MCDPSGFCFYWVGYWRRDRDLLFRTLASGERKSIKANFPFHCRASDAPTHSLAQQPLPYRTEDGLRRPHRTLPSLPSPQGSFVRETGNPPRWHNFCDDRPTDLPLDLAGHSSGLWRTGGVLWSCPVSSGVTKDLPGSKINLQ